MSDQPKSTDLYQRRTYNEGDYIIREGTEGELAFLIQSGSVEIIKGVDAKELKIADLHVGQIFGEMALIFNEPRSASVRAVTDCNLIVIDRKTFNNKLKRSDPTVRAIVKMLSKRVLETNETFIRNQKDMTSLLETSKILFDNVSSDLPRIKKRVFEQGVRPKFEAFIKAIEKLEERFEVDVDDDDD